MKNIWITGSTRGLGKLLADDLDKDFFVIRHGKQDGDLTNPEVVSSTVDALPKIDALVCCVGIKTYCDAFSSLNDLKQMMEINLYSAVMCCQQVVKKMKDGNIITIGSVDGCFGKKDGAFYTVAKAALHMFTRCFAKQLEGTGIKVNCIAPGTMCSQADRAEVVSFIRYLCTQDHGFSGQVIRIDKGHHTFPC